MSSNLTKKDEMQIIPNFVIFQTSTGKVNIEVFFKDETLWLSQKKMAELFEVNIPAISKHLDNIYESLELQKKSTVSILEIVQEEGNRKVKRKVEFYNIQAILSVGYRVNSQRAIEFRKWANDVLQDFIIKGFVMDDERLKQIKHFGKDYFDELLERIKEIRMSERRLYQKITDIYALSADYDNKSDITKHFFATVQNKLHFSITGKTAAEIIYTEAEATKLYMGLKTWKQAPKGKILKSDVIVARNNEVMNMEDWDKYLNQFLELTNYPILKDTGKISMLEAKLKAESEYYKFRVIQDRDYISDFDMEIKGLLK